MKIFKSLALCLVLLFCFAGWVLAAHDIVISTEDINENPKTVFLPGETVVLSIDLSLAAADARVAGCAFTVEYPSDVVTPPSMGSDGLPSDVNDIYSGFPFFYAPSTDTFRAGDRTGDGSNVREFLLSGAEIETDNADANYGGAVNHANDENLFKIAFTVKSTAPVSVDNRFSIKATTLDGVGGWTGQSPPVLIGAVPKTDSSYNDLSGGAFPVLLSSIAKSTLFSVSSGGGSTFNLDVDGNGTAVGAEDGLMILRRMFQLTGTAVTDGLMATDATRTSTQINAIIEAAITDKILDVDGNGTAVGAEDGLMILRRMFQLTGTAVTDGLMATDATLTFEEINSYIESLML